MMKKTELEGLFVFPSAFQPSFDTKQEYKSTIFLKVKTTIAHIYLGELFHSVFVNVGHISYFHSRNAMADII